MEFSIKSRSPEKQRGACVVVGVFDSRKLTPPAAALEKAANGYIAGILGRGDMNGDAGSSLLLQNVPGSLCDRVLLIGKVEAQMLEFKPGNIDLVALCQFLPGPASSQVVFALGMLQAQWTFTGFDASAHATEETVDPSRNAPWGIVLSVAVSGVAGYALLLVTHRSGLALGSFARARFAQRVDLDDGKQRRLRVGEGQRSETGYGSQQNYAAFVFRLKSRAGFFLVFNRHQRRRGKCRKVFYIVADLCVRSGLAAGTEKNCGNRKNQRRETKMHGGKWRRVNVQTIKILTSYVGDAFARYGSIGFTASAAPAWFSHQQLLQPYQNGPQTQRAGV